MILPGPGSPEGDPVSPYFVYAFVFLSSIIIARLYKLTRSDQPQIALQLRDSFQFTVQIFGQPALAGGPKKCFSPERELVPGAPDPSVRRSVKVLTNVVATELGKTAAVIANAAVVAAEAPSASTMRIVKDKATKSKCRGTRSSSLKQRPRSEYSGNSSNLSANRISHCHTHTHTQCCS